MAARNWQDDHLTDEEEIEPSEDSEQQLSDRTRSRSNERHSPLRLRSPDSINHSVNSHSTVPTEPNMDPVYYHFDSSSSEPMYDPYFPPPIPPKTNKKGKGPIIRHTARKKTRFPPPGVKGVCIQSPPRYPISPTVHPNLFLRNNSYHLGESSSVPRRVEYPDPRRISVDYQFRDHALPTPEDPIVRLRHLETHVYRKDQASQDRELQFQSHITRMQSEMRADLRAEFQAEIQEIKNKKGILSSVWNWIRRK